MGVFGGTLGQVLSTSDEQKNLANAIMSVLGNQQSGGLQGLVDQFVRKGLGEVINSWISPLENRPVSAAQVRRVLGREMIAEIALQARLSKKEASSQIAVLLPQLVDKLTPGGRIPPGQNLLQGMNLLAGSKKRKRPGH